MDFRGGGEGGVAVSGVVCGWGVGGGGGGCWERVCGFEGGR